MSSQQFNQTHFDAYMDACDEIERRQRRRHIRGEEGHLKIVKEVYAEYGLTEEILNNLLTSGSRAAMETSPTSSGYVSEEDIPQAGATSGSQSPEISPISSGYASEEDLPSSGPSSGYSSGTDSGLSSGAVSPFPATKSTKKITFGTPGIDFVFNIGATNATSSCHRTMKVDLGDGSFEMIVDPNGDVPKKIKVFTKEELDRQAEIVAEFKRNIMGSS